MGQHDNNRTNGTMLTIRENSKRSSGSRRALNWWATALASDIMHVSAVKEQLGFQKTRPFRNQKRAGIDAEANLIGRRAVWCGSSRRALGCASAGQAESAALVSASRVSSLQKQGSACLISQGSPNAKISLISIDPVLTRSLK
jgi:hypothetical protein